MHCGLSVRNHFDRHARGFRRYSGRSVSQPQTDHDPAALGRDGSDGRADSAEENPGKQGLSPARGDRPGVDDPRIDIGARNAGAQAVTANGNVFRTGNAAARFVCSSLQLMTAALPTPHLPREFASRFQSASIGAGFATRAGAFRGAGASAGAASHLHTSGSARRIASSPTRINSSARLKSS
jgi:hypothetical protein